MLGKGCGTVEQLVQRTDQLGGGTVVGGQAVLPRSLAAGFEVGGQVGATKPIDRLLRVTDKTKISPGPPASPAG
jgi:hypothetical protein